MKFDLLFILFALVILSYLIVGLYHDINNVLQKTLERPHLEAVDVNDASTSVKDSTGTLTALILMQAILLFIATTFYRVQGMLCFIPIIYIGLLFQLLLIGDVYFRHRALWAYSVKLISTNYRINMVSCILFLVMAIEVF